MSAQSHSRIGVGTVFFFFSNRPYAAFKTEQKEIRTVIFMLQK